MSGDLQSALDDAAEWLTSLAANGPDLTVNAHVKAKHEATELAEDPSLEELADVVICLVGAAVAHGWSTADVVAAVRAKTAVNRARVWDQLQDGTWQHRKVAA